MKNVEQKIREMIYRYERKASRNKLKESDLKEIDGLSRHGHWSLGYTGGKAEVCEDIVDDLKELLDALSEEDSEEPSESNPSY